MAKDTIIWTIDMIHKEYLPIKHPILDYYLKIYITKRLDIKKTINLIKMGCVNKQKVDKKKSSSYKRVRNI